MQQKIEDTNKKKEKSLQIKVPDNLLFPSFAQFVNVNVTNDEITLTFVYIRPEVSTEKEDQGVVTAKVVMPRPVGENLAKVLTDVIAKHDSKK